MVVCQELFLGWRVEIALAGMVGRGLWKDSGTTQDVVFTKLIPACIPREEYVRFPASSNGRTSKSSEFDLQSGET
jgi:hypothetical protein